MKLESPCCWFPYIRTSYNHNSRSSTIQINILMGRLSFSPSAQLGMADLTLENKYLSASEATKSKSDNSSCKSCAEKVQSFQHKYPLPLAIILSWKCSSTTSVDQTTWWAEFKGLRGRTIHEGIRSKWIEGKEEDKLEKQREEASHSQFTVTSHHICSEAICN